LWERNDLNYETTVGSCNKKIERYDLIGVEVGKKVMLCFGIDKKHDITGSWNVIWQK